MEGPQRYNCRELIANVEVANKISNRSRIPSPRFDLTFAYIIPVSSSDLPGRLIAITADPFATATGTSKAKETTDEGNPAATT